MRENSYWVNISDMMTVLMIVFLFIAISFMMALQEQEKKIKLITAKQRIYQKALNKSLNKEFKLDLKKWGAQILKDNTVRFNSPKVLFKSESAQVSSKFKSILKDFFPRYIKVMTDNKFKDEVDEIRVEGHTSSVWANAKTKEEVYINNMILSQNRSQNVLLYCYNQNKVLSQRRWLEKKFLSIGMAFSKPVYKKNGLQDFQRSRRVDFKVLTKASKLLLKVLN